uniref:Helix-turn-helix domain protein n=1 Tax=Siphoviridae sp. ct1NJ1 TaxID=2827557 RepID=A0A8S5RQQ9_9CAUD|nr:MAG TPA: helix-turn-helix domain protein [Siphoviridae sp. ct1NJ1]
MLFACKGCVFMELSKILRDYRQEHGLTLQVFADRAGLTKQYISMLENNKNSKNGKPIIPSLETLRKLASAMYMNIDTLVATLDGEQDVSLQTKDAGYYTDPEVAEYAEELRTNPKYRLLFDASKDLSKEDIDFVVNMIEQLKAREGK